MQLDFMRLNGKHTFSIVLLNLLIVSSLPSLGFSKPVHEGIWIGMPLKEFNLLNLGPFIYSQDRETKMTKQGVIKLDSTSLKRYFALESKVWKGIMVEIKNDQVKEYMLQGFPTIDKDKLQLIFSDLLRLHGTKFNLGSFKALSKSGYSVIWDQNEQFVSLNITLSKDQSCSISLKKARHHTTRKSEALNDEAIAMLEPFLGKDFYKIDSFQIVDRNKKNKLLDKEIDKLLTN